MAKYIHEADEEQQCSKCYSLCAINESKVEFFSMGAVFSFFSKYI